jgi:hypothetical protein
MRILIASIIALLISLQPCRVNAEDRPLVDLSRFSAAVGVNHNWFEGGDPGSLHVAEFEGGLYGAYNLLASEPVKDTNGYVVSSSRPILSLTGSTALGFDSRLLRSQIGLRLFLYVGGQ